MVASSTRSSKPFYRLCWQQKQVESCDIRLRSQDQCERFQAVDNRADHDNLGLRLEDGNQTIPDDRVAVDGNHACGRTSACCWLGKLAGKLEGLARERYASAAVTMPCS